MTEERRKIFITDVTQSLVIVGPLLAPGAFPRKGKNVTLCRYGHLAYLHRRLWRPAYLGRTNAA